MRQLLSVTLRAVIATALCIAAISIGWAQSSELKMGGYTVDDLVDLYVELALSREGGVNNPGSDILLKWPPDASVRILPQPSANLINRYGLDLFVDETKRTSDALASLVAHPRIVSFGKADLEEFARRARSDGTAAFFRNSVIVYIAPRDELFAKMLEIRRNNPILPDILVTTMANTKDVICMGWNAADKLQLVRAFLFIEYSDRFRACLYEEIMQSFGIPNDFAAGTSSIFNDDNVYSDPTELDLLLWRVHGNPRLKAGMREDEVRPVVREIIGELVASY